MSGLSLNANEFNTAVSNAYSSNLSPLLTLLKDVPLIVSGGTLDDNFIGGQKNDKFFGGVGSDTFVGNGGRDQMDGGVGDYDIVNYSQENGGGGIKVNLTKNTVVDTYGSVDTVKNMELIVGTDEVDTFVGSKTAAYEAFSGRGGGDTINGGGGSHNTVRYDYDNDYGIDVNLAGNPDGTGYGKFGYYGDVDTLIGIQDIIATNGQDTLVGSAEANTFTGLSGSDDINGGLGIDTINYSFENGTQGVTVDLERYFAFDSYGYKDTLVSIEDVLGTGFRDLMKGSSGNNVLLGLGGNDSLKGLAGIDRLEGGTGNDRLAGGLGNDRLIGGDGYDDFVFDTALNAKTNVDRITDFAVASDSIALENAIFKSLKVGDLAAGAFYIGSAAHDASDRIIYNNKTGALLYDADGKGGQAAVQFATLDSNLKLTADHFDIF
ncbi:Ca2+-binding protein, RTX toxin-related [Methylorubrum salsuginis]|uniref:Ca2+-binding protein, RTX toxin-related n=2 Tax=Methylorubrum salsuginis TaxID=414703 RepID=A0A1I3YAJ4_9HYPH|nr:Ca2+-binding protein, RTX toxin-related [Methylorubrum salsuginis]